VSSYPSTFRRRDVTAAIRAVEASGHSVQRVEIGKDGKIVIIPAAAAPAPVSDEWVKGL